jgi:hypothetical protein
MAYLDSINTTFADAVYRKWGYQSGALKAVTKAVENYQRLPGAPQIRAIREALKTWQRTHSSEYRERYLPIKDNFESELDALDRALVGQFNNNMDWVKEKAMQLEAFKSYAVEDVKQFTHNAHPAARQDCLARYADFAKNAPARLGQPINVGFGGMLSRDWNPNRVGMMHNFMKYAQPRTVKYTPSSNPDDKVTIGAGSRTIASIGSGVCTTFAYAAAHVLTTSRLGGPAIDIVSWMTGIGRAHCYVVIGREEDDDELPRNVDDWGGDIVIVDPWLAALGHKIAYRITNYAGDHPFPGFLYNVNIVMSREFQPFIW